MAGNIKGITIEIGGNTAPLDTALKNVNKTSRDLQSELKQVEKSLKMDPGNADLIAQKQKLLADAVKNAKDKVDTLKNAQAQVDAQFKAGKIPEAQYRAFQRELSNAESELKKLGGTYDDVTKKSSKFGEAAQKAGLNVEGMKTAFGAVGVAAAGYLKGAVDSATSAEQSTAALTNILKNQGLSANEAGAKIKEFQKTITDMSNFSGGEAKEALQTLTEKGVDVGKSMQWSTTIADVAKGSNKSLSESAGLVADAYNGKAKALVSLGILSKAEVKQLGDSETATISMEEVQKRLNAQFGGSAAADLGTYAGKMKENQNTINSAKAAIGTALLPVLAQAADALAKILVPIANFIKENPKFTAALLAIVAVLGTLIGGLSLFKTVTTSMGALGGVFNAVKVATMGMSLPMLAVIAIIALLAFGAYELITHWTQVKAFFVGLGTSIATTFNNIKNAIMNPVQTAVNFVAGAVAKIKGFFSGLKIELPKIKLPHFTMTGKFSLNPPSIPTLGVNWYDTGAIFNGPQIVGVGEKRPEFVGALDDLRYLIRDELNKSGGQGKVVNNNVNINNPVAEKASDSTAKQLTRMGYMGVFG
jgi:phage-related minor tail protein